MGGGSEEEHRQAGPVQAGMKAASLVLDLPYVPCCRWFHGKITREQAERLLYPPETGLFLVRESTNYPGDYTLCVSCEGKVEHYRIIYSSSKLSIDEEVYFENLMQLVEVRSHPPMGAATAPVPSLGTVGLRLRGDIEVRACGAAGLEPGRRWDLLCCPCGLRLLGTDPWGKEGGGGQDGGGGCMGKAG